MLKGYAKCYGPGKVFPSRHRLAERLGISQRTISRRMSILLAAGEVRMVSRGKLTPLYVLSDKNTAEASSEQIRDDSYRTFLQGEFWQGLRAVMLCLADNMCADCETRYDPAGLQVHHKTYAHHGYENWHLEDLEVLCVTCHGKKPKV